MSALEAAHHDDVAASHGMTTSTTVDGLLEALTEALRSAHVANAQSEAREIVSALYDAPRFWPLVNRALVVDHAIVDRARAAAQQRAKGAPMAYAVGRASFRRLTLEVDRRVLIPRPETEQLVELVLRETAGTTRLVAVDIGTGSGAIAIALATEGADRFAKIYATDDSLDAVNVARANLARTTAAAKDRLTAMTPVAVLHGSLLEPLAGVRPHVIVSNPPYIALSEVASLPPSVRDWEPASALFSGANGMDVTIQLIHDATAALRPGGLLAIEVDVRRAALTADLLVGSGCFHSVRVEHDLTGRERFVLARRTERDEA